MVDLSDRVDCGRSGPVAVGAKTGERQRKQPETRKEPHENAAERAMK